MLAVVVPGRDYSEEKSLVDELEDFSQVDSVMAIAGIDAMGGYKLADKLSPREFADLLKLDYETAELLYSVYAIQDGSYDKLVSGISKYRIPLIDVLLYIGDKVDEGYINLEGEQAETLANARTQMLVGKRQLEGENYDRMLVYLTLPESGDETFKFTDTIRQVAQRHYPKGDVYVVGNSTNQYEFKKSFEIDNVVVSVVSILIVLVVLLFTFNSAGMPVLLIAVIQGAIWMNFGYPALVHEDVFFMTQLVVSSIQMGANIDYAIVIANRYTDNIKTMERKDAIIEAMNFAFPTILTSGTILAVSGLLISIITTDCTINGIGEAIGRGTMISIVLVMFVLPQILLLGGTIIAKTSFAMPKVNREHRTSVPILVDGRISGSVNGTVSGFFRGTIEGDADLRLLSGKLEPLQEDENGTVTAPPTEPEGQPGEKITDMPVEAAQAETEHEAPGTSAETAHAGHEDTSSDAGETVLPSAEPGSESPEGGDQL